MNLTRVAGFWRKRQELTRWLPEVGWVNHFEFFASYDQKVNGQPHNLYQFNVHFVNESSLTDSQPLRKFQVDGANEVWSVHHTGVKIEDITGEAGAEQRAYKVILTDDEAVRNQDGGGHHDDDAIKLHVGNCRLNRYLLAHELGHVFSLKHPKDENEGSSFPGSIMEPRTPNLPHVSKKQLEQLSTFLRDQTENPLARHKTKFSRPVQILNNVPATPDLPEGAIPPFFVRSFHYDDGTPVNLDGHDFTSPNVPNSLQSNSDTGFNPDKHLYGWHSDICNMLSKPSTGEPTRCHPTNVSGYKHETPQYERSNHLYLRITLCDPHLNNRPVRAYLFEAVIKSDRVKLRPMRGLIQVSDTVSVLDNAVIFNPSVNTLKETVEWIPEKWVNPFNTEDTSATHPLWLVAIVWNYRMWFPDLPNSTSWVEQVITSTIQGLKSVYETYYFTKLKSFEFETDQATFKQWLAENRCIAVRRPGNPCA